MTQTLIAQTFVPVDPSRLEQLLASETYAAEPKLDGIRAVAVVENGSATLLNRRGVALSAGGRETRQRIQRELERTLPTGRFVLDGELMPDGSYWLFDIIEAGSLVTSSTKFAERRMVLVQLAGLAGWNATDLVNVVDHAVTEDEKRELLEMTAATGREGIMLKRLDRAYFHGRSKDGFKVKHVKDIDLVVTAVNFEGRDNAVLSLRTDDGTLIEVGRASTIGKGDVNIGDVVEVRFLYLGANGRLYQPRIMRVRDDKLANECTIDQLEGTAANKAVA